MTQVCVLQELLASVLVLAGDPLVDPVRDG